MDFVIGNSNQVALAYNGKLMGVNDFTLPFSVQNKSWRGLAFIEARAIWSDGENIYYSSGDGYDTDGQHPYREKVLDITTNTWLDKQWTVYNDNTSTGHVDQPIGYAIWTDGDNIYMSDGLNGNQLVLDKSTSTWYTKTWYGIDTLLLDRDFIWSDGDNIYCSPGYVTYVLDKTTSTWSTKTWSGFSNIRGDHVWTDGTNIFYSEDDYQYVLNKSTSTWSYKSWSGIKPNPKYIWKCGNDYYCTYGGSDYKLNSSHTGWTSVTFTGYAAYRIIGRNVWSIGDKCYYSHGYEQYEFNPSSNLSWDIKSWEGMDVLHGYDVWTDGEHVYYSTDIGVNEYVHLVLDKTTSTWSRTTFNGPQLWGSEVWYEGENVYWSYGDESKQYVFDKSASIWRPKTWNGFPQSYHMYAHEIWSDLTNICYGNYILDKTTSTWIERTITGFPAEELFNGGCIWNDGRKVYYSDYVLMYQFVLDIDRYKMTWSPKEWYGVNNPNSTYVWNYEGDTYYLYTEVPFPDGQYVLGTSGYTWYPINLGVNFSPRSVWTDGENYYVDAKYVLAPLPL